MGRHCKAERHGLAAVRGGAIRSGLDDGDGGCWGWRWRRRCRDCGSKRVEMKQCLREELQGEGAGGRQGRGPLSDWHTSPKAVALDVKAWMTSSNTRKECSQRPLEAGAAWEAAAGGGGHVPVATAPAALNPSRGAGGKDESEAAAPLAGKPASGEAGERGGAE